MPLAFIEDRQLVELSASPKQSLFPVLNRAEAMTSLIVLLALLPPLYVCVQRPLTTNDAAWGLKGVLLSTSSAGAEWLDPSRIEREGLETPLTWQPPLSSWLIAGFMRFAGTDHPTALIVTSLASTAGLILFVFGLSERLRTPQFAWWSTILAALCGPILQGGQTPAPVALALALSVGTFWGFIAHCQDSKRLVSWPLSSAGLAWGLCWLAGGPVAVGVLLILLAYVCGLVVFSAAGKSKNGKKSRRTGQSFFPSFGVFVAIGLAVGGWWPVWMTVRHGGEFLASWTGFENWGGFGFEPSALAATLLRDASQIGGVLTGLAVVGAYLAIRRTQESDSPHNRAGLLLLVAWTALASAAWLLIRLSHSAGEPFSVVWRGFLVLPTTFLTAFAIEQVSTRRIGYLGSSLALGISAALLVTFPVEIGFGVSEDRATIWPSLLPILAAVSKPSTPWVLVLIWRILFIVSCAIGVCWCLARMMRNSDRRHRFFLASSLVFFVAAHGVVGFLGIHRADMDDQALASLRSEMLQEPNVTRYTIIAAKPSPLTLRFTLATIWPNIAPAELTSWFDPGLTQEIIQADAERGAHIVVDWNDRDTRAPTLRIADQNGNSHIIEFTPVGSPQILEHHRLRLYRLTDRPIGR